MGASDHPSGYLRATLAHPLNLIAALSCAALSIFCLLKGAVFPAALFLFFYAFPVGVFVVGIGVSPGFRLYVDQETRRLHREEARKRLVDQIEVRSQYGWSDLAATRDRYARLCIRLASLRQISAEGDHGLSASDLERLDDATVEYLRVILTRLMVREQRASEDDRTLSEQIHEIDDRTDETTCEVDRRLLVQAKADLERLVEARARLPAREAAAAAQLVVMAAAFEEIYHRVSADPGGANVGEFLRAATERLAIEEEIGLPAEEPAAGHRRRKALAAAARERAGGAP